MEEVRVPAAGTVICRGHGRSYGDAALSSDGEVLIATALRAVRRFDPATGILTADAGLSIADLLSEVVPMGWFPPVTPGTKHVSLGGAVAADVHGKNHHRDGSFGNHVIGLELILADGRRVSCGPAQDPALFWATVGGMGLTGVIVTVTLQLLPIETSTIAAQHFKAPDLDTALRWLSDSDHDDQYTVAWVDCLSRGRALGRSVVMRGHHARRDEIPSPRLRAEGGRPYRVPVDLPAFVMNAPSVKTFNGVYYALQGRRSRPFLVDYNRFFYPLDVMDGWNRMYGRRGFLQYQFVVPPAHADTGLRLVLERVTAHQAVFLAVLKRFGPANPAPLSFPDSGYTLAMDLPMRGPDVLRLLDDLDDIVLRFGGRVYLAKDARLSPGHFRAMYPRLGEWLHVKHAVDPHERFRSDLSSRLGLSGAPSVRPLSSPAVVA